MSSSFKLRGPRVPLVTHSRAWRGGDGLPLLDGLLCRTSAFMPGTTGHLQSAILWQVFNFSTVTFWSVTTEVGRLPSGILGESDKVAVLLAVLALRFSQLWSLPSRGWLGQDLGPPKPGSPTWVDLIWPTKKNSSVLCPDAFQGTRPVPKERHSLFHQR